MHADFHPVWFASDFVSCLQTCWCYCLPRECLSDTKSDCVRAVGRDGEETNFKIPTYDEAELTHTNLDDSRIARQGFARGLCLVNQELIAVGSSPSTISLFHLEEKKRIASVNLSMDIRNAIHGLEVWPYERLLDR